MNQQYNHVKSGNSNIQRRKGGSLINRPSSNTAKCDIYGWVDVDFLMIYYCYGLYIPISYAGKYDVVGVDFGLSINFKE